MAWANESGVTPAMLKKVLGGETTMCVHSLPHACRRRILRFSDDSDQGGTRGPFGCSRAHSVGAYHDRGCDIAKRDKTPLFLCFSLF